jgi:hypothetical protein
MDLQLGLLQNSYDFILISLDFVKKPQMRVNWALSQSLGSKHIADGNWHT